MVDCGHSPPREKCPVCQSKRSNPPLGKRHVVPDGDDKWLGSFNAMEAAAVTVVIPHLSTPELLEAAVPLWLLQEGKPYILIVDTGSSEADCQRIEKLRSDRVEIHYLKAHGHVHSSAPVGLAMDFATARVASPFMFSTHTDVFPKRKDFLKWMSSQCTAEVPVVGWQMSERTGEQWKECVSHTATMWHMPTMRKIRLSWNFLWWYEHTGEPRYKTNGYPDTEQPPNLSLKLAGITPKLLGPEPNWEIHQTEWFTHARSNTCSKVHLPDGSDLRERVKAYTATTLTEARQRLLDWQRESQRVSLCLHLGKPAKREAVALNGLSAGKDWRVCDLGKGIVCPCGVCKTCPSYEADV